MAHHETKTLSEQETQPLGDRAKGWSLMLLAVGVVALIAGLIAAMVMPGESGSGLTRFGFSYLTGFAFALSIAMGSLLLVVVTHLFRAGWVVAIRRVIECHAAGILGLAVLFIPILLYVFMGNGSPYPWTKADDGHGGGHHASAQMQIVTVAADAHGKASHDDHAADSHGDGHGGGHAVENEVVITYGEYGDAADAKEHDMGYMVAWKSPWLNQSFFALRWIIYFAVWGILAVWYLRTGMKQDETGDVTLTNKREAFAPVATILFALTLTFSSIDLLMSLDPTWYSTMYGVYYFAGSMLGAISTLILVLMGLQRAGIITSITTEHYHDLGKLLLAFIVFWAYIAYSQFMLIWYGSIPAEQPWPIIRGMSTVHINAYSYFALFMLFGHFLVPFLFMMSRHTKRKAVTLAIGAVWMLVMHAADVFWLVMPEYGHASFPIPLPEILCMIGSTAVLLGVAAMFASKAAPVAHGDPRLNESLNFTNF